MIRKSTTLLGITLLILALGVLSTSTIFAAGATEFTAKILAKNGSGKFKVPVGEAKLTLENGVIKFKAETEDLEPGHVFSVWGFLNDRDAFNLTGFETDDDGEAEFRATVKVGKDFVLTGFKIKIKDHGKPIRGHIKDQKSTKGFGCDGSCPTVQTATFKIR